MNNINKILSFPFIGLVKLYRKFISPFKPPSCRFTPTCSSYAIGALEEWGPFVGLALALWRLLRCNPFSAGGYDPVPLRKKHRKDSPGKTDAGEDARNDDPV